MAEVALRRAGALGSQVAVGLVHHDQVGELHDPALDALQLVAARRAPRRARTGRPCRPPRPRTGRRRPSRRSRRRSRPPRRGACASRVRRATPPSVPPLGEGRMKASGWRASSLIRVLSPRIEPPDRSLDGSTASTATRWPCSTAWQAERLDERRLACARGAGEPEPHRAGRCRAAASSSSARASRAVVGPRRLDQRDGPGQRPAVAGADLGSLASSAALATSDVAAQPVAARGAGRGPMRRPRGCWCPARRRRPPRRRAGTS